MKTWEIEKARYICPARSRSYISFKSTSSHVIAYRD